MKTRSFRKLALIFSVVACVGYGIVLACADGWFYYDYDSNFTPEVFVDKSYSPLFFAPNETFYGNSFDTNYNGRFNDLIVEEWSEYLGSLVSQQQLSFLLLNDSSISVIQTLYKSAKAKTKAPAPYQNLVLSNPKVSGFIEFLYHARTIEKSSVTKADPWEYDQKPARDYVPVATRNAVEKLFSETRDPFLKNRYWFQTMKGYFYSAEPKKLLVFFDQTKSQQPKNNLFYRGLSYAAGIHYRDKNFAQANYLYSIVFDQSPALRQVAAYNFHPQEDADFHAALSLASDKNVKAALWALLGYYGDEFMAIQEINKIDPANQHLSYLLTRLVNKQEVALNNMAFKSAKEYKRMMREGLKKEVLQVVQQIANEGKTDQPALWLISAGYLNTFAGKYQQAEQYFGKALSAHGSDAEIARQVRLLRVINTACSLDKIDEAAEKKLLPELQWMFNHCGSAGEDFRCSHAINWSKSYVSSLYGEAGNPLMAELFERKESYFRNAGNLEAMKSFLQSTNRSEWQKFIVKLYPISLSDISEYQAVMSAFAGDLDSSIGHMEKSARKDIVLPGNPFNGKIKDCHDCDHAAPQKIKYTKLSMLQKMKEMQTNIAAANDIYNNSILLANAYYNITYHGNARVFYEGDIINQPGNYIDPFYHPQLLGCGRAREYYQKAFDAAATPEQKAKCVYMMAKCERNEYYNSTAYSGNADFDPDFVSWDSFKKLKEEYSATRYYQEVIKECGYFRTYLGMKD